MSWNGTVRCSHCYQTGHNRRGCPKLTEEIKQRYDRAYAVRDEIRGMTDEELVARFPAYRHRDRSDIEGQFDTAIEKTREAYLKRTKIDLATGKKVTNKAAKAARMKKVKCGYCGQRGHTRRTCQNLKNDYAVFREGTFNARRQWLQGLKERDLGMGAMVIKKFTGYGGKVNEWGEHRVAAVIVGFRWDQVLVRSCGGGEAADAASIMVKSQAEAAGWRHAGGYFSDFGLAAIALSEKRDAWHNRDSYTLIPAGSVPAPPANWLSDLVPPMKEVFPTKQERSYEYRGYSSKEKDVSKRRWQDRARESLGIPLNAYDE